MTETVNFVNNLITAKLAEIKLRKINLNGKHHQS